jgi:chorismate mutase
MDISDWRRQIDEIDDQLLELFNRRATCSIEIGALKRRMNLCVCSSEREAEVIGRALRSNRGPLDDAAIRRLFEAILEESRLLQVLVAEQEAGR